ncbi:MAG: hypothetical protein AAB873_02090, partial [Patescibacteria group bacterium]
YYDSNRGQFLGQDAVFLALGNSKNLKSLGVEQNAVLRDPQMMNSYSYAKGNPITLSDPNGNCPMCVTALIGAGAGMLGQLGYDIYSNVQAGGFKNAFSDFSSGKTYLTRAMQGGILGATGGAVGSLTTLGIAGQSAIVSGASALVGAAGNAYLGDNVSVQSVSTDAFFGALTFGLAGSIPKVPGRLPDFLTRAFFAGKHTGQSAAQLIIETQGVFASSMISGGSSSSKNTSQPKVDNSSSNTNTKSGIFISPLKQNK